MNTIRVLKGSRNVEFPEGITKSELVSIILKWAPKIANDDDKTPYGIAGSNPCESAGMGLDGIFADIFQSLDELSTGK